MRDGAAADPAFPGRRRGIVRPQVLPAILTLGNLFCGFLAIAKAADALAEPEAAKALDLLAYAGWLVFLGMIFDALDGYVARLSGGTSAMGVVLDSLADVVTFGAAPAFLAKCIAEGPGAMGDHKMTLYFSVFFALMAALRLARYSAHAEDPGEANLWFDGLPTPGAAGVIAGLAILLPDRDLRPESAILRLLPYATLVLGFLMVSRLPYVHFTNRFLRGRKPVHSIVIGLVVLVLALTFHIEAAIAGGVLVYALSGPLVGLVRRKRRNPAPPVPVQGGRP
jgi:CDP-diacylglycerol--serine O-phosphatidyltransferase